MKVEGSYLIEAPREHVWSALHDPAFLARTLPGCQQLEVTGPDTYAVRVTAGVASVKGTYDGLVELSDKHEPDAYRMRATGSGAPGTIDAHAQITLEEVDRGTRIAFDADAVVGGMIGGVGQRVLVTASKRTAAEFFAAVERELLGATAAADAHQTTVAGTPPGGGEPATVSSSEPGTAEAVPTPRVGDVFEPPPRPASAVAGRADLLVGFLVGAAVALAGVLVGRSLSR